jgi:glycosyltransferase involved in cell wall biosynthesis
VVIFQSTGSCHAAFQSFSKFHRRRSLFFSVRDGDQATAEGARRGVRAVFLYHNRPRDQVLAEVDAGRAPDTGLIGSNHLAGLGIEASVRTPRRQLKHYKGGLFRQIAWNARELPAPWELADADVACSFWVKLFPLAARVRGGPAVVAFNIDLCTAYLRSSPGRRRLQRAALRSSAAVVCFASAQRDRLLDQYDLDPALVHTVAFGVDERFWSPQPPPEDGYVLAVGADLARDYATFARAVEGLDARVVLVASERALVGVELPPQVEVQIRAPYLGLRDLYAGAACVVLPTRADGYPYGADCSGQTVLLDAMAMGRPVVASERETLADYVADGETALMVPAEDPDALRSALDRALGDRELAESIGAASRRRVEERFTTRHVAERLAPIIREAAADRGQ